MPVLYFCLGTNKTLALKTFGCLEPIETVEFKDGEMWVRYGRMLEGEKVVCLHTWQGEINKCLVELFIFLEGVKEDGAREIILILPYFFYGRQDRRFEKGCSVAGRWLIRTLESLGVDKLIVIDVHSKNIVNFCRSMEVVCIESVDIFASHLQGKNGDVVVAPDEGATERAELYSKRMGLDLAVINKCRRIGGVDMSLKTGDVKGKKCFVVDDILDTGGTMMGVVNLLKDEGAAEIVIVITHALFNGGSVERFRTMYEEGIISRVFVTNSISKPHCDFIKVVDISEVLRNAI